ncbi:heme-binding protein [Mycolicibacterium sp. 018/SC-01/001]|uniref:GlcG/HbpS family heme-binding protein n=1 Tax=Mycolicibacterium sp. 018/SC-01/001 TaxID=2592069 RepID=UPI00210716F1|nr:heme-binding protein [Mycolicibacterium sp. 018/SC-01/001]
MIEATTLDLAEGLTMVAAAHDEARRRGVTVSAAVVDAGGHLIAFGRMDGAEIAGPVLAVDKAYTAVAHRAETSSLADLTAPGGELFGMHANGNGRFVVFGGGVPVRVNGTVVGAVGVSGASAAEDEACAVAAVAALS